MLVICGTHHKNRDRQASLGQLQVTPGLLWYNEIVQVVCVRMHDSHVLEIEHFY